MASGNVLLDFGRKFLRADVGCLVWIFDDMEDRSEEPPGVDNWRLNVMT